MKRLTIVFGIALYAAVAAGAESVDVDEHGDCAVMTEVDEFTDALIRHVIVCSDDLPTMVYAAYQPSDPRKVFVFARIAGYTGQTREVDVTYRVDKGAVVTERWRPASDGLVAPPDLAGKRALLTALRGGNKLTIQIGVVRQTIPLHPRAFAEWFSRTPLRWSE